jgi:hypothetical protein
LELAIAREADEEVHRRLVDLRAQVSAMVRERKSVQVAEEVRAEVRAEIMAELQAAKGA